MSRNESDAFKMIKDALNTVSSGAGDSIATSTHLVEDEVLDSLDLMNFLFELEGLNGGKIEAITETFDDYRVERIVEILTA